MLSMFGFMVDSMTTITLNHICYLSVGELVYYWIKAKLFVMKKLYQNMIQKVASKKGIILFTN